MPYGLLEQNISPRRRHRLDQCLTCEEQSVRVLSLARQMQIAAPPCGTSINIRPLGASAPINVTSVLCNASAGKCSIACEATIVLNVPTGRSATSV